MFLFSSPKKSFLYLFIINTECKLDFRQIIFFSNPGYFFRNSCLSSGLVQLSIKQLWSGTISCDCRYCKIKTRCCNPNGTGKWSIGKKVSTCFGINRMDFLNKQSVQFIHIFLIRFHLLDQADLKVLKSILPTSTTIWPNCILGIQ